MNLSQIKELIAATPCKQIKSGAAAYFIRADKDWGVKFFMADNMDEKSNRNINYDRQGEFYDLQLAPKLGKKFDLTLRKEGISRGCISGFTTELVEVYGDDLFKSLGYIDDDDWYVEEGKFRRRTKWGRLRDILTSKMKDHGVSGDMIDLHDDNWGVTKDGEPVIIDFSHMGRSG